MCLVTQSCPTLCDFMDYSPPGSSVYGILQARILEWVAIPFSRQSSQHRDSTRVSRNAGKFFMVWATREAHGKGLTDLCHKGTWTPKVSCCCCCSGAKSCLTLCDPVDCSTPGFPALYCLSEFAQTHVHWVSGTLQGHVFFSNGIYQSELEQP